MARRSGKLDHMARRTFPPSPLNIPMPVYGISRPIGWGAAIHAIAWRYEESVELVGKLSLRCWNKTANSEIHIHLEEGFVPSAEVPTQPAPTTVGSMLAEDPKGVVMDAIGYIKHSGIFDDQLRAWEAWSESGIMPAHVLPGEKGLLSIDGQSVPVFGIHVPGTYWLLMTMNPVGGTYLAVHGYDEIDPDDLVLKRVDPATLQLDWETYAPE